MDLMQNCIPNSTTPFDARSMVLSRQVYAVAKEFDRERKSFVVSNPGQMSALSLTGAKLALQYIQKDFYRIDRKSRGV